MSEEAVEPTGEEAAEESVEGSQDFGWGDFVNSIEDEDLKKHAERYTDPKKVIEGNLEMRKKLSNAIFKPGEDSSEEDIATFREALGIPKTHEDYVFEGITDAKDMTPEQKEFVEGWQKLFHENGVTPDAAKAINDYAVNLKQAEEEMVKKADQEFMEKADQELRERWKGDEYDKNKTYAERAIKDLLGERYEDLKQMTDKNDRLIMDNPILVELMASVGREMGEGRLGEVSSPAEIESAQEAANEYRAKANAAMARGNTQEAAKWDAKEREALAKIPRSDN